MRLQALFLAILTFLLASFVYATAPAPAWADGPSVDAIVKALLPKPKKPLVRSLFDRGIDVSPDAQSEPPPQIDLTVNFDLDSSNLTNDGAFTLGALGKALMDPRLKDLRFRIVGHTDAVGSAEINQKLSEDRANAVKVYLIRKFGIASERLEASGRGARDLLKPEDPAAADNRRVEITNLGG